MAQEKSIEVKVGVLILVSLGILAAFVLVMGGLSFEKTYVLYVDFDNPGGLQTGAPVRVAGVKVGKVNDLSFMGGKIDPTTKRRTLVRAKISVEQRVKESIHEDADFYVTTQGVLGEQFMAIEPGSADKKVLPEGSIVKGIDPPRLDLFLAKAYELLDTTMNGIRNNRELISDIVTNTGGLLKGLNLTLTDNRERINRTMQNLEQLSSEANTLTSHARTQYVDNPKIQRTIDNIDRLSTDLQKDSAPMLKDARESLANLNRASKVVGGEEEQAKLRKTVDDVAQLAARANATASDAQAIVQHIKKGNGTVGALVMDEAIYDDVQEMVRDLKHNPWKFLWRE
ncbi:MAG: putative transporter, periplasmic component YrbD [Labilithrix sp.]|nr:putative transporter, periplasmic component YrbD [Labilithrix sp.]